MENLTHTLTGVMLSRTGLDRLTPRALWISVIAANCPDVDAVSILDGTETYFRYHRWGTHSLVFAPLVAVLPVLVVAVLFRIRLPWARAWLLSLIGVLSHILLDFTNPYGIRLWLPFSDAWPALDSTHVVDVWIWAILLVGFFWPMLSGLVSSEIGAKRPRGRGVAIAAIIVLALYDFGRVLLHGRAVQALGSRIYQGAAPRSVVAFPHSVNPMRWHGWVETERAWLAVPVDLAREFDPQPTATYWKPDSSELMVAAGRLPVFQHFMGFARTPYWRVMPVAGGSRVELIDLRFGRGERMGFTATALFDSRRKVVSTSFHY